MDRTAVENKIIQIAVREACPAAVDHGAYSKRTGIRLGPNDDLVHVIKRDGSDGWRIECRVCDTQVLDERLWPKEVRRDWVDRAVVRGVVVRESIVWEKRTGVFKPNPPCSVDECGEQYTQRHHFAPIGVFATEADCWPVSYLCVPHHIEWHRRMTGYAWCPKPVSAVAA